MSKLSVFLNKVFKKPPSAPTASQSPVVPIPPTTENLDLAGRIVKAMEDRKYVVSKNPGELNIVYLEGVDLDGDKNDNEPDKYNDVRMLIEFVGGKAVIKKAWVATTEPGSDYTENPVNVGGAARIAFGQYRAWQVGMHRGNHEAWIQTGGKVTVCRDLNKDYDRQGDKLDTGMFGINQHGGYDSKSRVGRSSAGCLVTPMMKDQAEFMAITKKDPRYVANHEYISYATIMPAAWVVDE